MARRRFWMKHLPFYRELRQARNAQITYHKLWPFLVNRFLVAPRLARRGAPLDRPVDTDRYAIHLLCSHTDLLAMLWTLGSWFAFSEDSAQVYIHDDESFTDGDRATLRRLFPRAEIVDYADATGRANKDWLKEYPAALRYRLDRRRAYAIKLMDPIFISQTRGILVMDTDILWFAPPHELYQHIRSYEGAVFWPSSGQPSRQPFRDGGELRLDLAALNSGIVYFERAAFEPAMLEEYCAKLPNGEVLLDQPGFAYVLGTNAPVTTLPVEHYHIHGAARPETIGKHYTLPRREQFWFEGVARLAKSTEFRAPSE